MGREIALRISDEVISPLATGVWRSAVILPTSAILLLSPAQLEAVLAHELAHVRRLDYLCNLLQTTAECLLFFHPGVWWVSRCTRELREVCCDEVAAQTCEDPVIYAEALLEMEELRLKHPGLAMALEGHNGSLLVRIRQILWGGDDDRADDDRRCSYCDRGGDRSWLVSGFSSREWRGVETHGHRGVRLAGECSSGSTGCGPGGRCTEAARSGFGAGHWL